MCLGQSLSTASPAVSLLHSTVNFDHFQILRAIGKGSFGKVRKSLWVGQWRVGDRWDHGATSGFTPFLLGEATPVTRAKSSELSGRKQGL